MSAFFDIEFEKYNTRAKMLAQPKPYLGYTLRLHRRVAISLTKNILSRHVLFA